MEQYLVSARLFRPDSFDKVVGQHQVTNTLKNALLNKCLAQAFLFCGPRGVGKTTCARILAKAINCEKLTASGEPCNTCQACLRSKERDSGSVFELDGASNNSVDDIRLLVEQIRYVPQVDKYRVYIIDEVHMLSTSAFNAFLKTLEEPPRHAIFILATTEKHKIIPTILSRCQVFDFRRVKTTDIVEHLAHVAHLRSMKFEKEALFIIAERADGSMRDALSTFDMVSSFERSGDITYSGVVENLHIINDKVYFDLIENIANNESDSSFLQLKNLVESGFECQNFVTGLNKHLRNLLVCKYDSNYTALLETTESKMESYKAQAGFVPLEFLFSALQKVNQCESDYKSSSNKQILVELMLLELTQMGAEKFPHNGKAETRKSETRVEVEKGTDAPKDFDGEEILVKEELEILVTEAKDKKILGQGGFLEKKEVEVPVPKDEQVGQLKEKFSTIKIPKLVTTRPQARPKVDATIPPMERTETEGENSSAIPTTLVEKESRVTSSEDVCDDQRRGDERLNLDFLKIRETLKDYALEFKAKLGMMKYNILMNSEFVTKGDEIKFSLTNPVEMDMLDEMKSDLILFIKQRLKTKMAIKIVQSLENLDPEKKPYTREEKLNFLEKKYPIINGLVQRFSLALDGDMI